MVFPRKLTFQLTPLLDLLLIVIFAQYMEVRHESGTERQAAAGQLQAAQTNFAQAQAAVEQAVLLQRQAERKSDESAQRESELSNQLKLAREQRDLVGQLATDLFHIPTDLVDEALKPLGPVDRDRPPEEVAKLRQKFREMGQRAAGQMVSHLLTYEEIRKRCDVWEIYIPNSGLISMDSGQRTHEFRADSANEFADQLFQCYKSIPQPKGLVIILLSYGNARAIRRQTAMSGLRTAIDRMRVDGSGRTRFEYAILGFRPRSDTGLAAP